MFEETTETDFEALPNFPKIISEATNEPSSESDALTLEVRAKSAGEIAKE